MQKQTPGSMRRFLAGLLLMAAMLGPAAFGGAGNRAVLVGIDDYPLTKAPPLAGCAHDARALEESLKRRGFEVTTLTGSGATRERILEALRSVQGSEHVVFFFAGYGSGPGEPRLLTADTREAAGKLTGEITLQELDHLLAPWKSQSKTVILDTCFNGGRASKDGPSLYASRYYRPFDNSRSVDLKATDGELPGALSDDICYITASRFNEEAFEKTFDRQDQGVFTHCLTDRLSQSQNDSWQAIQMDVSAGVAAALEDRQHPNFPSQFLAQSAFGGPAPWLASTSNNPVGSEQGHGLGGPPSGFFPLKEASAWSLFNLDRRDPGAVSLEMTPDTTSVKVRERLSFRVRVGREGYLLLIEHSVEGKLRVVFPLDGSVESARVQAGQQVDIPGPGIVAYADTPGRERVKAFILSNPELTRSLLSSIEPVNGASFGSVPHTLSSRSIRLVTQEEYDAGSGGGAPVYGSAQSPVFTADLSFEVR